MDNLIKVVLLIGFSVVTLSASGWRIPEQSLHSTALSAAYVAGANEADASYYNPANMVWNEDANEMEIAFTYINLTSMKYIDSLSSVAPQLNGNSEKETFYVPTFFYVSPAVGDWRFGLSMTAPGGLSKRWENTYQKASSKEFSLKVIEMNPSVAYKISDQFSVGFGVRALHTSGKIKLESESNGYHSEMEADSVDFGYNLAMSYKPVENLTLSLAYRSKVDLTVEGDAKGIVTLPGSLVHTFDSEAKTQIPLPAVFALAVAYTKDKTTLEIEYDRTYWSDYDSLQFIFNDAIVNLHPIAIKKIKGWRDSNTYRIGITHKYSDKLKLMAGFAIDKNPVPDKYMGFELPDSDAKLYSAGFEYKISDAIKIGLAYLYDEKESRAVDNRLDDANPATGINGEFKNASAHLVTASFKYKF